MLLGYVCCTRLIRTRNTVCSTSTHLLVPEFDISDYPLEFEASRCITSQFARCFLLAEVRMWNNLPYTAFDIRTLDGFICAVNRWLLLWVLFSSVFRGAGPCGVTKAIYKQFCVLFGPVLLVLIIIIIIIIALPILTRFLPSIHQRPRKGVHPTWHILKIRIGFSKQLSVNNPNYQDIYIYDMKEEELIK